MCRILFEHWPLVSSSTCFVVWYPAFKFSCVIDGLLSGEEEEYMMCISFRVFHQELWCTCLCWKTKRNQTPHVSIYRLFDNGDGDGDAVYHLRQWIAWSCTHERFFEIIRSLHASISIHITPPLPFRRGLICEIGGLRFAKTFPKFTRSVEKIYSSLCKMPMTNRLN